MIANPPFDNQRSFTALTQKNVRTKTLSDFVARDRGSNTPYLMLKVEYIRVCDIRFNISLSPKYVASIFLTEFDSNFYNTYVNLLF